MVLGDCGKIADSVVVEVGVLEGAWDRVAVDYTNVAAVEEGAGVGRHNSHNWSYASVVQIALVMALCWQQRQRRQHS